MKNLQTIISRFYRGVCIGLATLALYAPANASPNDEPYSGPEITQMLGLGIMFEAQIGQAPDITLSDPYETVYGDEIESAGFDSVRIRLDMDNFTYSSAGAPNYSLSAEFMADLEFIVDDLLSRNNNTMVVLISPKGLEDGSVESVTKQTAWWQQIAENFQHHSHRLIFNLLNEPRATGGAGEFDSYEQIQELYESFTNVIRITNPSRYIVYYQLYKTFDGPGETDFHTYPLPAGAAPYAVIDTHVLGEVDSEGEAKRMGKLRAAWEYREVNDTVVWSGAWQMGAHDSGYDTALGQRVVDEFVSRGIPGTYLMFNGGQTSIYDTVGLDRDNDGIHYEWTRPDVRDIVTSAGDIIWNKGALYEVTSYRAQDDTYVASTAPDTIRGTTADLQVKSVKSSYLKFPVLRLDSADITNTRLKLLVTSAQGPASINVHVADSQNWSEASMNYNNAVTYGTAITSFNVDTSDVGNWIEVDVTDAITANSAVTLVLTSTDSNLTKFHSRDGDFASNPDLIVSVDLAEQPPSPTEITEDFESAGFSRQWSTVGIVAVHTAAAFNSNYGLRLKEKSKATMSFSSEGLTNLQLSYDQKTIGLKGNEKLIVEWSSDAENWQQLEKTNVSSWSNASFDLPVAAEQQADLSIRFRINGSKVSDKAYIDNIVITAD